MSDDLWVHVCRECGRVGLSPIDVGWDCSHWRPDNGLCGGAVEAINIDELRRKVEGLEAFARFAQNMRGFADDEALAEIADAARAALSDTREGESDE